MLPLILRAEPEDRRTGLTISDPVRRHRGTRGKQFLHDDETGQRVRPGAAVLLRKCRTDPAPLPNPAAELRIESRQPAVAARQEGTGGEFSGQEVTDFISQAGLRFMDV